MAPVGSWEISSKLVPIAISSFSRSHWETCSWLRLGLSTLDVFDEFIVVSLASRVL